MIKSPNPFKLKNIVQTPFSYRILIVYTYKIGYLLCSLTKIHPNSLAIGTYQGFLASTGQAAAVTVFAAESFNYAHPMLVGNAAEQGSRPRSCGEYPVRRQHHPARATACLYFSIALGKSRSGRGLHLFFFWPLLRLRHLPSAATSIGKAPTSKKVL